ncbi:MAG: trypsin-like peptidase domain-containing protein [Campylobacterota bacterium]|nr:trypsin-like peptidase domain-containing protein [Campylobacterota bacterium]
MDNNTQDYTFMRSIRILLLALVSLFILFLLLPRVELLWISMHSEPRAVTPRGDLGSMEKTNIEIFQQASPSVVYITTLVNRLNYWTRDITRIPKGTGSGFIWDAYGHIITNYHVLKGASEIKVRLSDSRTINALFIGASPDHDLAVLRIPLGMQMPKPLSIGSSDDLKVGQITYAIGNPFGLDQTLTTGVVSALNRSLHNDNGSVIKGLIQTDAAINPGNSGGPLIDSAGRLVGINTAIYSPSGAYAGIGFAVPVDTVNRIVPKIIAHGNYQRPKLGITINEDFNKVITQQLGTLGVAVIDVQENSSASFAGLEGIRIINNTIVSSDLIIGIDHTPVKSIKTLLETLEKYTIGDTVTLKVIRDKKELAIPVVLQ